MTVATFSDGVKVLCAVLLPPLGVYLEKQKCDKDLLINVGLTLLG